MVMGLALASACVEGCDASACPGGLCHCECATPYGERITVPPPLCTYGIIACPGAVEAFMPTAIGMTLPLMPFIPLLPMPPPLIALIPLAPTR